MRWFPQSLLYIVRPWCQMQRKSGQNTLGLDMGGGGHDPVMWGGSWKYKCFLQKHFRERASQRLYRGRIVVIIWCLRKILSLCLHHERFWKFCYSRILYGGRLSWHYGRVICYFMELPGFTEMFSISGFLPSVISVTIMSLKCSRVTKHISQVRESQVNSHPDRKRTETFLGKEVRKKL